MSSTENGPVAVLPAAPARNRYDRAELAGAFGDLGTLIPFVVAYINLLGLDPFGVLLGFGASMIVAGFYYKTPFPVQPMKAIGAVATTQAAQTATITAGAVYGASLVTGAIWLILGATGTAKRVADLVSRPVAVGIILGLGLSFMFDGAKFMATGWWLSGGALFLTLILLTNRKIPAMFLLLAGGAIVAIVRDPTLLTALGQVRLGLRLPSFALGAVNWHELVIGTLFLAIPQVPLTLGNAIIAITEENNRLFPDRPVSERKVAISTGVMNLASATVGGIPMCHGAGGMAGHVAFGARTGGSLVMLGSFLLFLAVFMSSSIGVVFRMVPPEVLGVILFLAGAQLALGSCDVSKDKGERFTTVVTAGLAMWNVGIAFVVGLAAYHAFKRRWIEV
ncbi:MAG: putative sulfate/molybdate transporter [Alphaproteobacteria bacterium]|nr:putative sulfate/molybdate transporter [Alphaproteobacteria bacterium]